VFPVNFLCFPSVRESADADWAQSRRVLAELIGDGIAGIRAYRLIIAEVQGQ
jgi:hypothetical protein